MTQSVNINIRISPSQRRAFNLKCERDGFHQAEVLRRLIDAYLDGRVSLRAIVRMKKDCQTA